MGLIDDLFNLRARYKFIFQVVAALIAFSLGVRISGIKIPFIYTSTIELSWWVDFIFTMVWIMVIIVWFQMGGFNEKIFFKVL